MTFDIHDLDKLEEWAIFLLPVVVIFASAFVRRRVEGGETYKRHHFYLGLDLTFYCLACLTANFIEIAQAHDNWVLMTKVVAELKDCGAQLIPTINSFNLSQLQVANVILFVVALVAVSIQLSLHNEFTKEKYANRKWVQGVVLLGVANVLGSMSLYWFTIYKFQGRI